MKYFRNYYLTLFVSVLYVIIIANSCSLPSQTEIYLESFQSNSIVLNDIQESKNWSIELNYYTPEFMALNESINDESLDFKKVLEEYSGVEYYKLKLQHKERSHKPSPDFIGSFPFKFNESIGLISNQDTLRSELYHFESDLSGQNIYTFLLAFQPLSHINRNFIILNVEGENVNLGIAQSEINKIPKLSL